MIPHVSKLKNITDFTNFTQEQVFEKTTSLLMVPTIYNENNPHYNTVNNKY